MAKSLYQIEPFKSAKSDFEAVAKNPVEKSRLKSHTQRSVDASAGLRSNMASVEGE